MTKEDIQDLIALVEQSRFIPGMTPEKRTHLLDILHNEQRNLS